MSGLNALRSVHWGTGPLVCIAVLAAVVIGLTLRPGSSIAAQPGPQAPPLPLTFTGSYTDVQAQPSYPTGRGSERMGDYSATVTLRRLVLQRSGQIWSMTSGEVSFGGFSQTETYDSCSALWTFPATSSFGSPPSVSLRLAPIAIGSSRTTGFLDFSIELRNGSVQTLSGCDPSPDPVYGRPGVLLVSGHAPVVYNMKDGKINVDATYAPTVGAAATGLRATDKGEIVGGLLVYDESVSKGESVTNARTKVTIGERVKLVARFADGGDVESPRWSGIAGPDAIKRYIFEDGLGSVTDLKRADLDGKTVQFYWIHSYTYTVRVTAIDSLTGKRETGLAVFVASAPRIGQFIARTCRLGALKDRPGIGLGSNRLCGDKPGVAWAVELAAPRSSGVAFGITQLITDYTSYNGKRCQDVLKPVNYGLGPLADGSAIYANARVNVPPGKSRSVDGLGWNVFNDSPDFGFARKEYGRYARVMTAVDYLMVKPETQGSIWVALRKLRWQFAFSVRYEPTETPGESQVVQDRLSNPPIPEIESSEATAEPEWTGVALGLALTRSNLLRRMRCD
jgi:hypothetical protein